MVNSSPLDYLPPWALVGTIGVVILILIDSGFRLGKRRFSSGEPEATAAVGTIVGSILGLLAFMLAFTFGLAASRFEVRRQMVVEEANAIGTTFLRAGFLAESQSKHVRSLLREYVASRLEVTRTGDVDLALKRADQLHLELWKEAEALGAGPGATILDSLFIQALNQTIDVHAIRVLVGLRNRLPMALWLVLFLLTALSMLGVGYHEALTRSKRSPATLLLVLGFLAVLALIIDLDRPMEGYLSVSQEAMLNLQSMIENFPQLNGQKVD
jgi:hypothetical protein